MGGDTLQGLVADWAFPLSERETRQQPDARDAPADSPVLGAEVQAFLGVYVYLRRYIDVDLRRYIEGFGNYAAPDWLRWWAVGGDTLQGLVADWAFPLSERETGNSPTLETLQPTAQYWEQIEGAMGAQGTMRDRNCGW